MATSTTAEGEGVATINTLVVYRRPLVTGPKGGNTNAQQPGASPRSPRLTPKARQSRLPKRGGSFSLQSRLAWVVGYDWPSPLVGTNPRRIGKANSSWHQLCEEMEAGGVLQVIFGVGFLVGARNRRFQSDYQR